MSEAIEELKRGIEERQAEIDAWVFGVDGDYDDYRWSLEALGRAKLVLREMEAGR